MEDNIDVSRGLCLGPSSAIVHSRLSGNYSSAQNEFVSAFCRGEQGFVPIRRVHVSSDPVFYKIQALMPRPPLVLFGGEKPKASIPPLSSLTADPSQLDAFFSLVLEPSDILHRVLVPHVYERLQRLSAPLESHDQVLRAGQEETQSWDNTQKEALISGHPLIGEVAGLSQLSSREQKNTLHTPPAVLKR